MEILIFYFAFSTTVTAWVLIDDNTKWYNGILLLVLAILWGWIALPIILAEKLK